MNCTQSNRESLKLQASLQHSRQLNRKVGKLGKKPSFALPVLPGLPVRLRHLVAAKPRQLLRGKITFLLLLMPAVIHCA
jgi:hypothetical protein